MRFSICVVVCLLVLAQLISCWKLAPALEQLRKDVNSFAPRRSTRDDGSIGDAAHSARASDHNPDSRGIVHAIDITHDPRGGFDSYAFAEHLKKTKDPRVKYVISCRKIWTAGNSNWKRYTGSNNHCHHVHISLKSGKQIENNVSPWNVNYKNDAPQPQPEPTEDGEEQDDEQEEDNSNPRCKAVGGKCQVGCVGGATRSGLCSGGNSVKCCIGGNPIVRSSAPDQQQEEQKPEQEPVHEQEQQEQHEQEQELEHEHEESAPVEKHHAGGKTRVNVDVVIA